jgi:hypothetical protein
MNVKAIYLLKPGHASVFYKGALKAQVESGTIK